MINVNLEQLGFGVRMGIFTLIALFVGGILYWIFAKVGWIKDEERRLVMLKQKEAKE